MVMVTLDLRLICWYIEVLERAYKKKMCWKAKKYPWNSNYNNTMLSSYIFYYYEMERLALLLWGWCYWYSIFNSFEYLLYCL